jgi:hypothetical protein
MPSVRAINMPRRYMENTTVPRLAGKNTAAKRI